MPVPCVHFTPAHKYDTVLDKGGGMRQFCSVLKSALKGLRYYNIDPPGLLESTDPHTYHCSL